MSRDTSIRRFLCGVGTMCGKSLSQSMLGGDVCVARPCASRVWGISSFMPYSVVWCLVSVSIVTRRRSCAEYRAPPPLSSDLIAAWVSWQAALYLLINLSLWVLHCPPMCVQEYGSPHSVHASMGACLYLNASLPL